MLLLFSVEHRLQQPWWTSTWKWLLCLTCKGHWGMSSYELWIANSRVRYEMGSVILQHLSTFECNKITGTMHAGCHKNMHEVEKVEGLNRMHVYLLFVSKLIEKVSETTVYFLNLTLWPQNMMDFLYLTLIVTIKIWWISPHFFWFWNRS